AHRTLVARRSGFSFSRSCPRPTPELVFPRSPDRASPPRDPSCERNHARVRPRRRAHFAIGAPLSLSPQLGSLRSCPRPRSLPHSALSALSRRRGIALPRRAVPRTRPCSLRFTSHSPSHTHHSSTPWHWHRPRHPHPHHLFAPTPVLDVFALRPDARRPRGGDACAQDSARLWRTAGHGVARPRGRGEGKSSASAQARTGTLCVKGRSGVLVSRWRMGSRWDREELHVLSSGGVDAGTFGMKGSSGVSRWRAGSRWGRWWGGAGGDEIQGVRRAHGICAKVFARGGFP
ncbi:hypothetical protein B0H13DRAFT_2577840, partial [Mycena leptocephala]